MKVASMALCYLQAQCVEGSRDVPQVCHKCMQHAAALRRAHQGAAYLAPQIFAPGEPVLSLDAVPSLLQRVVGLFEEQILLKLALLCVCVVDALLNG